MIFSLVIIFSLLKELYSNLNQCNSSNVTIELNYDFSDLSQVRNVYKQFVLYSSIRVTNIEAKAINDFIFANYCTNEIDLSKNHIEFISAKSFSQIVYLEKLNLARNWIASIDNLIDSLDVETLTELDLSFNKIQKLSKKFTSNFINVNKLALSFNGIDFIEDRLFENLKNLKILYLDNNKLKTIRNYTFYNLVKLDTLDMSYNSIAEIESDAFKSLNSLRAFTLKYNNLEIVYSYFGQLINLQTLSLNSNNIKEIQPGADFYVERLELDNNQLDSQFSFNETKNLNELSLSYNPIVSLRKNAFIGIQNLESLSLQQSKIEFIEVEAFKNLSLLSSLTLSYNRLKTLQNGIFEGLESLISLYIDYNIISTIDSLVFRPLLSLDEIRLDHNMIVDLPSDLFLNLNYLDTIYLDNNQMDILRTGFIRNLPNIAQLIIAGNNIEHIERDAFFNLSNLHNLDLSSNKLKEIKDFYFKGLDFLDYLTLKNNGINTIEKNSFDDFNRISRFDLSDNFLFSIDISIFNNIKISSLILSNNRIEDLDLSNITEPQNIKYLYFSQNKIKVLRKGSLNIFKYCIIIDFSYHQIESISSLVLDNETSNAQTFILNNNFISNLQFLEGNQFINLVKLDLSFNLINQIFSASFKSLTYLNELNLGSNQIKFIDNFAFINNAKLESIKLNNISYNPNKLVLMNQIKTIYLSMNYIDDLGFLNNLTNLKELYLRNTNFSYTTFNVSLFTQLSNLDLSENKDDANFTFNELKSLDSLSLSNMGIESLNRFKFSSFRSMSSLNLSYNEITSVEKESFNYLYRLSELDLSNNKISFIDKDAFQDISNSLNSLYLQNNCLKLISVYFLLYIKVFNLGRNLILEKLNFISLGKDKFGSSLEKIDLSKNSLDYFPFTSDIFEGENVEILQMNNNKLKTINNDHFSNLIQLAELYIYSNLINSIEAFSFSQLEKLETLRLDDNLLTNLENRTFSNLFHLKYLNLSFNQLEFIDKSLFSDLYNLETLDLSFNRIKSIESLALSSLRLLQIVYINDNSDSLILSRDAFYGLESIVDIHVSFNILSRLENEESLKSSLKANRERNVNDVVYYRSINILYYFNYTDPQINCTLVLQFLKKNIQINLKDDYHLSIFLSFCQKLDLF